MKKSKVILAIALAVVLVITCISVPTFSWFTRPKKLSGNTLSINETAPVFNAVDVSVSTFSSTDGKTYSTEVTGKTTGANGFSGSNIAFTDRKYFKTTLANQDENKEQNVSLYISRLAIPSTSNGTMAVGVNGPTRMYTDFSALATQSEKADGNYKRVYLDVTNNVNGWTGGYYYVCYGYAGQDIGSKGENGTYVPMTLSNQAGKFSADIPKSANQLFFCVKDWGSNGENGTENWWQRTQLFSDLYSDGLSQTQSKIYKVMNVNDNGNAKAEQYNINGACFVKYYSNISLNTGSTFNAALESSSGNVEYISNQGLKYSSSNTNVFTVNENTGAITAKGAGTATLYTEATGGCGDTVKVETTVKVTSGNYEFADFPIVKNVQLKAKGTEGGGDSVDVYWYVKSTNSNSLSYTIDGIYIAP